jgi:nitroimidazol reductase NimA-like FMN-containing flavoprotein (pyridoxamine 5'-phosphate oxidase superfamily)
MSATLPEGRLDGRFSSPGATPRAWAEAVEVLEDAEMFWLSTVRADGRPHVVPLIAIWAGDALYFSTGYDEQKARNLGANAQCVLSTGRNSLAEESMDVVIEGEAARVTDEATLRRIAARYVEKYGEDWRYDVEDGGFRHAADTPREDHTSLAMVFAVKPVTVFGFGRGAGFSQTRWRFQ